MKPDSSEAGILDNRMLAAIPAVIVTVCACIAVTGHTDESSAPPLSGKTYRPPKMNVTMAPGWSAPQNLGSPINTDGWEDSASISPDGQSLYFSYADYDLLALLASGGRKRVKTGPDRGVHRGDMADIMVSRLSGGAWQTPYVVQQVSTPFALDDGAFTQDGKLLVHSGMRNDCIGGPGASDIFMSVSSDGVRWSASVNIGQPVCTTNSESNPWISNDGNLLLFDSNRPGGSGSRDLWLSEKRDGRWHEPVNLGPPVNTEHEEIQPFINQDGQELWFAGGARDGSGDHVIYMSRRNSSGKWSEPQVMARGMVGEPTLTADNQHLFFVHIYHAEGRFNADIVCSRRQQEHAARGAAPEPATEKGYNSAHPSPPER